MLISIELNPYYFCHKYKQQYINRYKRDNMPKDTTNHDIETLLNQAENIYPAITRAKNATRQLKALDFYLRSVHTILDTVSKNPDKYIDFFNNNREFIFDLQNSKLPEVKKTLSQIQNDLGPIYDEVEQLMNKILITQYQYRSKKLDVSQLPNIASTWPRTIVSQKPKGQSTKSATIRAQMQEISQEFQNIATYVPNITNVASFVDKLFNVLLDAAQQEDSNFFFKTYQDILKRYQEVLNRQYGQPITSIINSNLALKQKSTAACAIITRYCPQPEPEAIQQLRSLFKQAANSPSIMGINTTQQILRHTQLLQLLHNNLTQLPLDILKKNQDLIISCHNYLEQKFTQPKPYPRIRTFNTGFEQNLIRTNQELIQSKLLEAKRRPSRR